MDRGKNFFEHSNRSSSQLKLNDKKKLLPSQTWCKDNNNNTNPKTLFFANFSLFAGRFGA